MPNKCYCYIVALVVRDKQTYYINPMRPLSTFHIYDAGKRKGKCQNKSSAKKKEIVAKKTSNILAKSLS